MKESVKNFELGKPKMRMLHGHTKIELTDVNTGKKEVYESDNTFQGGILADLFDNIPILNENNNRSWDAMVGGLLLFKNAIEVGTRFMPAGNKMIGNGYRGGINASTPNELGTFNDVESAYGVGSHVASITQVWDFATNQANGTIGCVCLTSKIGGAIGYGNQSDERKNMDWTLRSFAQDGTEWNETFDDDAIDYSFYCKTDGTVDVTETRRVGVKGSVFSGMSETYNVTPDTAFSGTIVEGEVPSFNVGNHKIRFVPHGARSYGTNATVPYFEFDTSDRSLKVKTFTNTSTATIFTKSTQLYYYAYCTFVFTRTGKVICMFQNGNLGVFNLTNSSYNIISKSGVSFIGSGDTVMDAGEIGENLYIARACGSGNIYYIADFVNDTIVPCNSKTDAGSGANACNDKGLVESFNRGSNVKSAKYMFYNPLYLATINNLQSPVTKTAAQTMKVTYTLTEA